MSQIQPIRIGIPGRAIFAAYHPPSERPRDTAILLCNPALGEATHANRLLRVLAERMARAGYAALRFDYSCTGDSDGHCEDADVARWKGDILSADKELRQLSGCKEVAWIGLRAGGNLALAASWGAPQEPVRLLIWEGLTDPRDVDRGEELRSPSHVLPGAPRNRHLLFRLSLGTRERHGLPISERLAIQLSMLVKEQMSRAPHRRLTWLSSTPAERLPGTVLHPFIHRVSIEPWLDESSTTLLASHAVSADVLKAIEAEILELP
jgi:hypothetical protein